MSNHSIIEHRANYHYLRMEEDYLAICSNGKCSPHCKAQILSVLESWTNTKREKGESEYVYLTMPQWIKYTYMLYERNIITDCIKELLEEGFISRRQIIMFDQKTFEYKLMHELVNQRVKELPQKDPKEVLPRLDAYIAYREKAKEQARERREAKKLEQEKEGVRDFSRTSRVGDKSRTVREKSTGVREKSTTGYVKNHHILESITNLSLTSTKGDTTALSDDERLTPSHLSENAFHPDNSGLHIQQGRQVGKDGVTSISFEEIQSAQEKVHQEMGTHFPSSSAEPTQEKSSEVHRLTNPSTTLPEKIVDADESARRIEAETQDCASGLQVISAQKDALSTAKKQPEPNIRIAPKVQQKTPKKVEILPKPERPQMPPASMKWGVEKMVQITEAKRYVDKKQGAYFSEKVAEKSGKSQRDRQLEAAKKILALQIVNPRTDELENITEEHYLRAYNIRNDEWWNGEQGSLTVEDMYAKTSKKKIRILEVLERNDSKSAGVGGNAKRGTLSKQREDVHRQAAVTVATSVPPIDTEKLEAEKQAKRKQVDENLAKLKHQQEENLAKLRGAM